MNLRNKRLSELMHHEIGSIIHFEMRDARVKSVTITQVVLNADLTYAKVYFMIEGSSEEIKAMTATLNHAKGFIRHKISERIEVKYIPEIKFFYDENIVYDRRMDQLFEEIKRP